MKTPLLGISLLALTGCANVFTPASDNFAIGGQNGDLRVIVSDTCFSKKVRSAGTVLSLATFGEELLANLGASAFKSFGTFLKDAGADRVTRSTGIAGGQFYSAPDDKKRVAISVDMRCIYIVRDGFGPMQSTLDPPAGLEDTWAQLKLKKQPDLFAILYLEASGENEVDAAQGTQVDPTAPDAGAPFQGDGVDSNNNASVAPAVPAGRTIRSAGTEDEAGEGGAASAASGRPNAAAPSYKGGLRPEPPFFRLVLDTLYVSEFQDSRSASSARDFAVVVSYGTAASQAVIRGGGREAGATNLTGRFAVGGIRVPGVKHGYYDAASVSNLQTAWMAMPPTYEFDARATVDITVDVIEFSPGNQFLADIGTYLSGPDTVQAAKDVIASEIDLDGSRATTAATATQEAASARFDAIAAETVLIRTLQDRRVSLEALIAESGASFDKDAAVAAARALEDQLLSIERRQAAGWITTEKLGEVRKARAALADPRLAS